MDPIPVVLPIAAFVALGVGVVLLRRGRSWGRGLTASGVSAFLCFFWLYFVPVWRLALTADTPDKEYGVAMAYLARGAYNYPNRTAAARWFEKAAVSGYPRAQYEIGLSYLHGWGVREDDRTAYAWFQKAYASGIQIAKPEIDRLAVRFGRPPIARSG